MWGFLQLTIASLRWSPKTTSHILHSNMSKHTHTYIYIYIQVKTLGRTKIIYQFASFMGSATRKSKYINIYVCVLSTRDLSMAGFMTTDCWKKSNGWTMGLEKGKKPDVLSVGLPAANYSFFAMIPKNNISYIAFQHEQTHTYIYICLNIYLNIYIYTSESLGRNQNSISIRFFHGECHQEIKVYIYIWIYMFLVQ